MSSGTLVVIIIHGEMLWKFRSNGGMNAGPMTYMVDGKQYVAVPIGQALFVFELMEN